MNFLNPLFLFGLIAVAVPVVIHLINLRRPQKISFSTLSFFNELRKSTIRRIRIKQYLLMAIRALALLFLALALARPFLPPTIIGSASSHHPKTVAIIIDNSPSMSRIGSRGPLINQAKQIAVDIIDNGNTGDKFSVIATNGEKETNISFGSALQAKKGVNEISVTNTAHYTGEALGTAYRMLQQAPQMQGVIYLISDGQQSQLDDLQGLNLKNESSQTKPVSLQLITLQKANQQNIAISSLALNSQMLSKGSPLSLSVTIENVGDAAVANHFVSIEVNGKLTGQYEVSLQPGQSRKYAFEIVAEKTGDIVGRIILEGDDVTYDNTRYFVIRIPQKRSILLVNNGNQNAAFHSYLAPALKAAQQTNAQLTFAEKAVSKVDQSHWQKYDVIVLDGLEQVPEYWFQDLQRYVQKGNGLLFLPSEQGNIQNYNDFFALFNAGRFTNVVGEYASFKPAVKMAALQDGHPVISNLFEKKEDEAINVDLPSLFFYYKYEQSSDSGALNILKAANGDALLSEQHFGEGIFLISTFGAGPGWSSFPVNPLFAPVYYRSLLYAASSQNGGLKQHQLGELFEWSGKVSSPQVILELNGTEFKPDIHQTADGVQISYKGYEWKPGILAVKAGDETHKIAVNQSIMESRFGTLSEQKLQEMTSEAFSIVDMINAEKLSPERLNEQLTSAVFGKDIWNWFIWLALLFLITETMISRLYKAESIT
ncbi:MAG TPA: BatA domain-containing protein [Balneolaceae bacterium]|nr:BatA domain-containing protein [Balneolaceae bacterium]